MRTAAAVTAEVLEAEDLAGALVPIAPGELRRAGGWRAIVAGYLDAEMDSPHTRAAYGRHLAEFFRLTGAGDVLELTAPGLAAYRGRLVADGRGTASHKQAISAVRSFLDWCETMAQGQGVTLPVPFAVAQRLLKAPGSTVRRPYQVLSEPEVGATLAAVAADPRDLALLSVLLGGGLRVAEAVGLDVEHLSEDADGGAILYVRQGKGRKDRTVPLRPGPARAVRLYLEATGRTLADLGPLFLPSDARWGRGRLSVRAVEEMVKRVMRRAGVAGKKISPHSLRHTYAIRFLRAGGNVKALQSLLGHASIATTQRYLEHLELGELRAQVPDLPELAA